MSVSSNSKLNSPIKLYVFDKAYGLRQVGPFCAKLEMLFTSLDVPFEQILLKREHIGLNPKAKTPFVEIDGEIITDSEVITHHVDGLLDGKIFEGLSSQQRSQGLALARLAEEHLYWIMVHARWANDEYWENTIRPAWYPSLVQTLEEADMLRKVMLDEIYYQGLGRHTREELEGFARRDLDALQDALPEHGYLFGETPCIYDFAITCITAGIYDNIPTWVTSVAEEYKELHKYTERVQEHVGVYMRK